MVEWVYRLQFESVFSIYSGMAVAGLVDRMVIRDENKLPTVHGSTIKGRWRFFAEKMLRSDIGAIAGSEIHIHDENGPVCKSEKNACTLCRWFGCPSIPSGILVGPARLTKDWRRRFNEIIKHQNNPVVFPDTEIRPGIAVSRRYRTALRHHFFFDEAVPSVVFEGVIRLTREPNRTEAEFLINTARMVDHIGSKKGAGRGRLCEGIHIGGEA